MASLLPICDAKWNLLPVVHAVLEEPSPPRFVLTGSSARKLRRADVNLLGGRALYLTLHPFMAAELPDFDLDRALRIGLVPLVVAATDPGRTLDAYASLYIDQEVRAEGLTRDVGAFARFLEAITFSHGGELNLAAVARECEVGRRTVAAYVEILEDLLMAFRLPVFRKRAKRATVARDKLYLFDAGVFRSLRPTGPLDRSSEIEGQALDGLVAQHLRAWTAYSANDSSVFHWRTRGGLPARGGFPSKNGSSPGLAGLALRGRHPLDAAPAAAQAFAMRRSVALLGLLALSWSQVVALHCDMGTGAPEHAGAPQHAAGMQHAATPADQQAPDHAPPARHGQDHGGDRGCLMIMACGYTFVRHAQSAVTDRFPGAAVRAVLLATPIPVTAEPAVDTPPPRLTA